MVGRELTDVYPSPRTTVGEVVFEARNVGNNQVRDVSFVLRRGEILGFGGLVGAGRTELARSSSAPIPFSREACARTGSTTGLSRQSRSWPMAWG
ncbi:MAG: hypothetical protein LBT97_00760 [Planctomycetota bacterium]|nr:hypothetical protein [Planctomycetota bacterium]